MIDEKDEQFLEHQKIKEFGLKSNLETRQNAKDKEIGLAQDLIDEK